jgi:hypothetical protein
MQPLCLALALIVLTACPASAQSRQPRQSDETIRLLAEVIDTKDFQQPMALREALGLLTEKFAARGKEFPVLVDDAAFRQMDAQITDMQVQLPPYPRRMSVDQLLTTLLSGHADATYFIRLGVVVITTQECASLGHLRKQSIHVVFDKRPLGEALGDLSDQTGVTITIDPRAGEQKKKDVSVAFRNIALEDAVTILANMHDLEAVFLDSSIYITTTENALSLRDNHKRRSTVGGPRR